MEILKRTTIDFNTILKFTNLLLYGMSLYLYNINGPNDYINSNTIILASIFTLENLIILFFEEKKSNPFVIILVFISTVFYLGRITTLLSIPHSPNFDRDSITYEDLNYTFIFIIFANTSMYLGFFTSSLSKFTNINVDSTIYKNRKTRNLIIILAIAILLVTFGSLGFSMGWLVDFLVLTFFHQEVIFIFTFCYLAYHYDRIPSYIRYLVIFLVFIFILFVTLGGSRSGILTSGYLLLISLLVVKYRVRINRIVLISSFLLIPISVSLYIISTFNRNLETKQTSITSLFSLIKDENILEDDKVTFFLSKIYERVGFLDYSVSAIKNREIYETVLNPIYLSKSIVDNLLTPGFNIFNTVKVTNTLNIISLGQPLPSIKQIETEYNSDMIGIYGEYYVLFFGYGSLPIFFLIASLLQKFYNSFSENKLRNKFFKSVTISIFFLWLNSYGTDWVLIETVSAIFTSFFLIRFYV